MFKAAIKKMFELTGYTLYKRGVEHYTMEAALLRLKKLGIEPESIVDIGAAEGNWTKGALKYWPTADCDLIEPLQEQEHKLKILTATKAGLRYHLAVAGDSVGQVQINITEDLDGSGIYQEAGAKSRAVPVIRVDDITKDRRKPFLIKFDTHGYEMPILAGATETLLETIAIVMEVYGFRISPTSLLFHEMTADMESRGFRLADIVDVGHRQKDGIFWQADAIFLRSDHPVFLDNKYR